MIPPPASLRIAPYAPGCRREVLDLILGIQRGKFGLPPSFPVMAVDSGFFRMELA
jgi:hypothetical protein